jgi:hypothetical protein
MSSSNQNQVHGICSQVEKRWCEVWNCCKYLATVRKASLRLKLKYQGGRAVCILRNGVKPWSSHGRSWNIWTHDPMHSINCVSQFVLSLLSLPMTSSWEVQQFDSTRPKDYCLSCLCFTIHEHQYEIFFSSCF